MAKQRKMNAERSRLEQQHRGEADWRLWGPYLSERAWGTVREDYSPGGTAWEHFDHDQARLRAYRWNEDGLGGICDEQQRLCFALALWNGRDPILKERLFGLTGNQGNCGEDVKEYYFYRDATPSQSYLRFLYKYPQQAYPYAWLVEENSRRQRTQPPFNLLDTGVFEQSRYWDVEVFYAKASPVCLHVHIDAHNRGPEEAQLHLLPTLWFRNTWSWSEEQAEKPVLRAIDPPPGAAWAVVAEHPGLGRYFLYGAQSVAGLFTENESNAERLGWGANRTPYVKDAFHRRVIQGDDTAVNPASAGTKFAAWSELRVAAGSAAQLDLVLSSKALEKPFANNKTLFSTRQSEATVFYDELLPEASPQDHRILRQSLAGMIWSKQFFHYDAARWLDGDIHPPPPGRQDPGARNTQWRHLRAADVISMPDAWEYPWFAAWDLAYHCAALALVDVDFAKHQIELMLSERYLHPNGQIPAYEWAFGDVNPPVHAMGALKVFRAERVQRGAGDRDFLQRIFHKLLLNYAWWINRKDTAGHNLFEGGFLGLDNISAFDRSHLYLPPGWLFKQADATGWMAMFSLNMTIMALELAVDDRDYEGIAIQCYEQFLAIADAIAGGGKGISLWNEDKGFFMDLVVRLENGKPAEHRYIEAYSWVGLIPLFATEIIDKRLLKNVPRFRDLLHQHKGGMFQGHTICLCPEWQNDRGEHLLALVDHTQLPKILEHLLNETEFLSRYGIRSVSQVHAHQQTVGWIPGWKQPATIEYSPGESTTPMFGGNSNWRGPVWMPTNYSLVQTLEKYHRFLGPNFRVRVACLGNEKRNLQEIATLVAERLVDLYRQGDEGMVPALRRDSPFQHDPHWRDLFLFYEYFHAETGQGLGAAHQTGWTGLLANLVMRRYQKDITPWSGLDAGAKASPIDEMA